ncbi:hypothetical protein CGLO_13696 [Colletotrichum gloeosporioides Cg-14]|uniref:Uncharacterized protein n=1 Tax=Colletotrichum gloeosporioides (strain Cg-14) TaxID=1237896 RepID=T0LG11_COLGC|nr:hypothetical protein CGLO_13696 [Colletotrichum gloeosporioides Cg-14]
MEQPRHPHDLILSPLRMNK